MRRCPETGTNCFDPGCAAGCQGYDIQIEAVTVVHVTMRRRAAMSLVFGGGGYQPEPAPEGAGAPLPPPRKA